MEVQEDFAGRLRLVLKAANLSPAALGAAVGVDKSVVSRWLSGRVRPTQHNLTRIAAILAERVPGFSVLSFEAPGPEILALLQPQLAPASDLARGQSLPIPFGLLDAARGETGRRGVEYFGIYSMYYWSFGLPGQVARMTLMLRPHEGLIEARYGAEGFAFRGWALLLLNRMYMILAEERFEAMAFLVTNAGRQPKAHFITGVLSGPAQEVLMPTASPVVLVRTGDLTADAAADLAAYEAGCSLAPAVLTEDVPPAVMKVLHRPPGAVGRLMQVPLAAGDDD